MATKRIIMENAWKLARQGAKKFGGKAVEYIAEAMKAAWAAYKALRAKKGGQIAMILPKFLKENYSEKKAHEVYNATYTILDQTEDALYISAMNFPIEHKIWVPKSAVI